MVKNKNNTNSSGSQRRSATAGKNTRKGTTRRQFLGHAGAAAALVAGALKAPPAATAQNVGSGSGVIPEASPKSVKKRIARATALRKGQADQDAGVRATNIDNGDNVLYPDKGGTYTKALPHDSFGRVDPAAFGSFQAALTSGNASDFEKITMGGARTQNGPQGGLAFDIERLDSAQFGQPQVPPAPPIAGDVSGVELLEHYWAALLRDVAFSDYGSNALAAQAAAEFSGIPSYPGPRASSGAVTTDLLFRGSFPGETLGPYLSQFFVKPTALGTQPITQQLTTYLPDIDYMTTFSDWLTIQNGGVTGEKNQIDPQLRYARNGSGGIYACGCAVSGLFYCLAGAWDDPGSAESRQPICWIQH